MRTSQSGPGYTIWFGLLASLPVDDWPTPFIERAARFIQSLKYETLAVDIALISDATAAMLDVMSFRNTISFEHHDGWTRISLTKRKGIQQ